MSDSNQFPEQPPRRERDRKKKAQPDTYQEDDLMEFRKKKLHKQKRQKKEVEWN